VPHAFRRRTRPWRPYDDSRGGVRHGGRSLGVRAAHSGSGWSANVFADPSESMPGSAAALRPPGQAVSTRRVRSTSAKRRRIPNR